MQKHLTLQILQTTNRLKKISFFTNVILIPKRNIKNTRKKLQKPQLSDVFDALKKF